ncbi:MAG: DUF996 domain-containing protein [Candidatus Bathyarchaeia archaeon]
MFTKVFIESSKILAAIGAILMAAMAIPVVGIVGIILVLIGLKGLAEHYRDESIYQNAFKGLIFGIIGIILFSLGAASMGLLGGLFFAFGLIAGLALMLVAFIFMLLMAINFRKSLFSLADRSGEHLFHTAGSLLFIGAVLTIILVGWILVWISLIIAAIAFFTVKPGVSAPSYSYTPPPTTQPPPTAPTAAGTGTQYCPNCGGPVSPGAGFCSHCGKPI